jgi:hypothetical protein
MSTPTIDRSGPQRRSAARQPTTDAPPRAFLRLAIARPKGPPATAHARLPLRTRFGVSLLCAVGLLIGGFLWFKPYDRSLVGYLDGRRDVVESECPVPIVAVMSAPSDRALNPDGTWSAGDPPCQRSAGFRVGLGTMVAVIAGGWAFSLARRVRRTSAAARPAPATAASGPPRPAAPNTPPASPA